VRFSKTDSKVGKKGLQDLLCGLLTMEPDNLVADLVGCQHLVEQSFILGSLV
jgi:hypothetical protein